MSDPQTSMAMKDHPSAATELLLSSMFDERHPGRLRSSFLYKISSLTVSADVYYDSKSLLKAALYLRKHGSPHLRLISIGSLEVILRNFIITNYHLITGESPLPFPSASYAERLLPGIKAAVAGAMARSDIFIEPQETTLFPLVPIIVAENFQAPGFFFAAPDDLAACLKVDSVNVELVPGSFPPFKNWNHRQYTPVSWLGVQAATLDAARQMRAAILGAVALRPHYLERYAFSGREMFGGYATVANGWKVSIDVPNTPPLMTDIVLDASDHSWLKVLAGKVASSRKIDKRHLRALEYYFRAWAPDPVKRFPTLFASLDAIFGDAGAATQAIVDAVKPVMGPAYTSERVRLMLGLRASVIHGGAPNVYESNKYQDYYEAYEIDATHDLELIVARSLQSVIFSGSMTERSHTDAELIFQKTGRVI